jgi:hypothetical protein
MSADYCSVCFSFRSGPCKQKPCGLAGVTGCAEDVEQAVSNNPRHGDLPLTTGAASVPLD